MRGLPPGRTLLLATLAVALSACALPRPEGPAPLYDFDTVWLNDGVGGVRPWRGRDRARVTAAAVRQEDRLEGRTKRSRTRVAKAKPRPKETVRHEAPAKRKEAKPARPRREQTPKRTADAGNRPAKAASKSSPPAARVKPPSLDPPPAAVRGRVLLGDGSVPGELLVAAQRMVGIKEGFGDSSFLDHVLTVAAVDMDVAAPRARFDAAVLAHLEQDGRTFAEGRPEPGDLAFFRVPRGDSARVVAAVVERVAESGVAVCIGEIHGEVQRFMADPSRPWVRRDDRTGEVVNAPIRRRTFQDDPDAPALAGALFAAWARP